MGCIRAEERHRDLIFLCGKETLRYHQAVVSPFSDMLTNLFALQNNCTGQCLDNRDVIVTLDNISCHTVHILMNTVYTGRCENVKVSSFREIEILRRMLGLNINLTGMEAHIKVEMLGIDYPQALCTTSWGVGGAHRKKPPAEKLYHCEVCSMGFSRSYNLKVHMRIHSGERPYACDVCPMSFAASHNLTIHKRIHTGEKPFACDQCQRAFSASDNLKKHKRVHTGEKPFACDECPRAFSASGNLKVHKRTHTGERPYCCSKCPKAFSASDNLTKHRRRHLIAAQKALGLTGKDMQGFTGNEFKGFTNNDFKSVGFQSHPTSPLPNDDNQSDSAGTSKQETSPHQQPNDVNMSPCSNNTSKPSSPRVNNLANHQAEIITAQKTMGFNPDFNFQKPADDIAPKQIIAQKSMGFPRLPDVPRLSDDSNIMDVDWQKQDHSEDLQQSTSRPTSPSTSPDPSSTNKEESVSTPHSVFDSWHP